MGGHNYRLTKLFYKFSILFSRINRDVRVIGSKALDLLVKLKSYMAKMQDGLIRLKMLLTIFIK